MTTVTRLGLGPARSGGSVPRIAGLLLAGWLAAGSIGHGAGRAPKPEPFWVTRNVLLPRDPKAARFAVIGDSGTGEDGQRNIAALMLRFYDVYPFDLVLMLGDNLYGNEQPADYASKFEDPYRVLLDSGVRFRAALGNHDDPNQRFYANFNMGGERYYTFTASQQSVRFFALDSNYMDPEQLDWLERELKESGSDWKICFLHHPLYSSGKRHGPDLSLRSVLEPSLVRHGVDLVFAGHEHFYERLQPQNGIAHFIAGSAAKLRRGGIRGGAPAGKGYDQGLSFLIAAVLGDELYFQVIAEDGQTVDSGIVRRRERGGLADGEGLVEIVPGLQRPAELAPAVGQDSGRTEAGAPAAPPKRKGSP